MLRLQVDSFCFSCRVSLQLTCLVEAALRLLQPDATTTGAAGSVVGPALPAARLVGSVDVPALPVALSVNQHLLSAQSLPAFRLDPARLRHMEHEM